MKKGTNKLWIPLILVTIAGVQSFGIDAGRTAGWFSKSDSLGVAVFSDSSSHSIAKNASDSLHPFDSILKTIADDSTAVADSANRTVTDSTADSLQTEDEQTLLTARDTIIPPDSLKESDPFKFKYYVAIKDSTTLAEVRDSLIEAADTLELMKLDSLYFKDSTETAAAAFASWYNALSKKEKRAYKKEQKKKKYEQELPAKIAEMNRKAEIKDSLRAVKDSIIGATPRILETFAIPDSMQFKQIITWTRDINFPDVALHPHDTSYHAAYHDFPITKNDVNATWLGVAGSAAQYYNYFQRTEEDNAIFFTPYRMWGVSADNVPFYNSKTPYTILGYSGTLFNGREKEEMNVRLFTTQNILPSWNVTFEYRLFGSNGQLQREATKNKQAVITTNYLGKRYLLHAGYIFNKISRAENGGITDIKWIRDTTVNVREIPVTLSQAKNTVTKHTVFADQSYRIPFDFSALKEKKAKKKLQAHRDSIRTYGDSLAIAALNEEIAREKEAEAEKDAVSEVNRNITTAFIGHSSEFSVYSKYYKDIIQTNDVTGRDFYNNAFYIHPTNSSDSMRVMKFENKIFLRLQPWASDAILSRIDVGVGDKWLNYYNFSHMGYLGAKSNTNLNSLYVYAGLKGQYKNYLEWNAQGKYNFLGYELNDFGVFANVNMSFYPFRRDRKSPLSLLLHFETTLKEPDYYQQHMLHNHYKWDNNFSKISTTKAQATLSIPRWGFETAFGYALLGNNIYYDTKGIVRQNNKAMSVFTALLREDLTLWKFHLDNRILFQYSTNGEVLPLPLLSLNLKYYLQFTVVKDAMDMQIGGNLLYNTLWYAPGYNPNIGVFHNQNTQKFGNCPYLDVFVNMQWKRVCLFLRVENVTMGKPDNKADYFAAQNYIAHPLTFKVGISWPFYINPGRGKNAQSGNAGAGSGEPAGGTRLPGGLSAGNSRMSAQRR